jgi:hypothetical protein
LIGDPAIAAMLILMRDGRKPLKRLTEYKEEKDGQTA